MKKTIILKENEILEVISENNRKAGIIVTAKHDYLCVSE